MGDLLDLALALDERRIGVHLENLLGERTVRTLLGRGGHHNREVKELAQLGVREDVLAVKSGIPVTGDLVKADLEVEDEQHLNGLDGRWRESRGQTNRVVLGETLPWDGYVVLEEDIWWFGLRRRVTITADSVNKPEGCEKDAGSKLHLEGFLDARWLFGMLEKLEKGCGGSIVEDIGPYLYCSDHHLFAPTASSFHAFGNHFHRDQSRCPPIRHTCPFVFHRRASSGLGVCPAQHNIVLSACATEPTIMTNQFITFLLSKPCLIGHAYVKGSSDSHASRMQAY